jgi:hypothetical protein
MISSCGGSGGGDSGSSQSSSNINELKSSSVVYPSSGNTRKYDLTGTVDYQTSQYSVSGTQNMIYANSSTMSQLGYGQATVLSITSILDWSDGSNSTNTFNDYYINDYWMATTRVDDGLALIDKGSGIQEMSNLTVGKSDNKLYALHIIVNNDYSLVANSQLTYTVAKTEVISTPAGTFNTYKISYSLVRNSYDYTYFSDVNTNGTVWFYPSIGAIKTQSNSSTTTSGGSFTDQTTTTLKEYTTTSMNQRNQKIDIPSLILEHLNKQSFYIKDLN